MYKRKDHYYKKAREEGYRSRGAYKLKEINKKFHLIKKGDRVLDLGSSPGGWLQVAREIVGDDGYLMGVDKKRVSPLKYANVETTLCDIKEFHAKRKYDAVLSDMAPKTMGKKDVDQYRSYILAKKAFQTAEKALKEKGKFLTKIFQSEHVKGFSNELKKKFDYVKPYRPKTTRKGSYEVYIICKSFKTPC
ncbi:MAG: RlmE family RNA methyltransferase [Euryarchaeota archaeon]|nr:RlmE family RNA methyltransferase [Euryarchaeota archaeon]